MASTFSVHLKQRNRPATRAVWTRVLSRAINRKYLLQILLVFTAYVVAGKLGQATANIRSSNLGPVWPAYGIALAAILICGYRVWPGVASAAFLVAFFSPVSHLAALGQAAGATIAAMTGAFLLHRIANFNASLSRLSDALSLIAIGGFGSAMVSASIGMLVLYSTHVHPYSGWGAAWLIYWLGDSTGVLLVTPVALRIRDFLKLRGRTTEFSVLLLLTIATCIAIFGDLPTIPVKLHFMAFAVLPYIIWAAVRFGISVTALCVLLVATLATIETALGSGLFAGSTTFANAVLLDIFFGVLSVSGLSLAAVIEEREHAEHERERVISEKAIIEAELHANERIRESEERLRLATQAGKMFAYSWDAATDAIERSGEAESILGIESDKVTTGAAVSAMIHPADRDRVQTVLAKLTVENPIIQVAYRIIRPDGQVVWLERHSHAYFDERGKLKRVVGMIIDLTERKKAEEALRVSEERLRLAQQAARLGTFERDVRSGRITWAEGLEPLYGLPPGSLDGKTTVFFKDLIHPDDWEQAQRAIRQALATGQATQGEWRAIWPDGSVHWIASRWQVLTDVSGERSRVAGVNMDVTERKLAEQKLHEYERAVEGSEEMIVVVDREYRYVIANQQFLKMRNMTREQVVGHSVRELMTRPELFEEVVKPKLDECFQGKAVRYEMKYPYPQLGERDLLVSYFPVEVDGGIDRATCILHDITERKVAEETRFRHAAIIESSDDAIVATDVSGTITDWNKGAERLFGYSADEAVGKHISFLNSKLDGSEEWQGYAKKVLNGEAVKHFETVRRRKDGTDIDVSLTSSPIIDTAGRIVGISEIKRDITERKRAEEALADMSRKLIDAQEQERARIARELHDDINQRLALLSVELEASQQNPPDTATDMSILLTELRERMDDISSDVQSISRQLHSSQLEYLGIVAAARSFCREISASQNVEVDFNHDDIPRSVPQDISLCLFRVLQEALHNVAKYSQVRHVEVRLSYSENQLGLTVSDRGVGFDLESALSRKGLGLTSMKERVRLVNGMISIESKPMHGTTIRVRVPLTSEDESRELAV